MNSILVCAKCGADKVHEARWINPNDSTILESVEGVEPFCEICQNHTEIIEQKDYKGLGLVPASFLEDWHLNYSRYEGIPLSTSERYDLLDELQERHSSWTEDDILDFLLDHTTIINED